MKATKFKLFAMMITLAAVITTISIPAHAQRRSTNQSSENRETTRNRNEKRTIQKKRTFNEYEKVSRAKVNSNLTSTRNYKQGTPTNTSRNSSSNRQSATRKSQGRDYGKSSQAIYSDRGEIRKSGSANTRIQNSNKGASNRANTGARMIKPDSKSRTTRSEYRNGYSAKNNTNHSISSNSRRATGRIEATNREFYRVDKLDKRYTPNRNYKGSANYWSGNQHPNHHNYRSYGRDFNPRYNYQKHNHWDRSWERFRWNQSSWYDYYRGYHPQSYLFHKNYYHHNYYGHIIRRFEQRPHIFVHNHRNYYCYDGHFFRYRRGIGYVLVDLPFGFAFDTLPYGFERVYINGYLYFRVGNLFLEWSNNSFSLVHYPERYYAINNDYHSMGHRFYDDF